jgi:hypothetical protein
LSEPPKIITFYSSIVSNPKHTVWKFEDQLLLIIFFPSLIEEAMAEVIDLFTSHTIWTALEFAFSHILKIHEFVSMMTYNF